MNRIKNVVFDIGRVLISWEPVLDGVFEEETSEIVEHAIFGSGLWDALDLGVEEDEAIIKKMIGNAPDYREQIMYVLWHIDIVASQEDYTKGWIEELKKKGHRVYFLSNYSRHLRATQPQLTDFTPLMDGGIFSSDVKMVKPDHEIYKLLFERYKLVPEECLFVDDRQDNVDAAVECGMRAIRFDGYDKSYDEIMRTLED
jgi:putative hydrolase of the HAD superfamily